MSDNTEYKRRNMGVWNEVAPRYHKRWASTGTGPFQSTEKLVEYLDVERGFCALDVACGTGAVTKALADMVGESGSVVAADTSMSAIRVAQEYGGKQNVLFVNADAENMAFARKFDIITCQFALFFFPDAAGALKSMRGYLAESGRLGISVHGSRVPFFTSIYDAATRFIPDYDPPGTPNFERYNTEDALRAEVEGAGFSDVTVHEYLFEHSPGKFEDYWSNYMQYVAKPIKEKLAALDISERKGLEDAARENTSKFTDGNGKILFPWQVLILTANY